MSQLRKLAKIVGYTGATILVVFGFQMARCSQYGDGFIVQTMTEMLTETPIGTDRHVVLDGCSRRWTNCKVYDTGGFIKKKLGQLSEDGTEVGKSHMEASEQVNCFLPGICQDLIRYWGFDPTKVDCRLG